MKMDRFPNSIEYRLKESDLPTAWYNFLGDLPEPLPDIIDDGPVSSAEINKKLRPAVLIEQNAPKTQWVDIPTRVMDCLIQCGRPTPLRRSLLLEKYLDTPARIYLKREDSVLTGSFKLNTAIAQAYYAAEEGREILISETGAGQWGMAVALTSQMFGLKSKIFMARCSLAQKPYRKYYMEMLGTEVFPSPSGRTRFGSELLAAHHEHPGSIGSAISEAIEYALETPGAAYISGSNINHVHLHQTLLGLEVKKQLELAGEDTPDQLIACVSGGSNLCGFMLPFLKDKNAGRNISMLGVESTAAPRLTTGVYEYCRSDLAGYTPQVLGYSMGKDFIPGPVHAGGLRNHNSSPLVSSLYKNNILDAIALDEKTAFEAGQLLLKLEGLLVAPESSHAIAAGIQEAMKARETGEQKVIVLLASGNGFLDLQGYHDILTPSNQKDL